MQKHDQKTRHVGLAHVAQPSYRAFAFSLAKFSLEHTIRCCVRCWGLSGLPSSSALARRSRGDRLTGDPRFCPCLGERRRQDGGSPYGRNKLRPSLGFGPVAGWSSPRNRVTKSHTRRCQRSILPSPSQFLSRESKESIPHSPAAFKREMRFLEVCRRIDPTQVAKTGQTCFRAFISSQWDCGRGRSSGVRGRAPPRWRLSMRRVRRPRYRLLLLVLCSARQISRYVT